MMKVKVIDVKFDVSEIEIDVKDELSDLLSQCDNSISYDGPHKVVENTKESNEKKLQSYEMTRKCDSSRIGVEMTEDSIGNNNNTIPLEIVNETCNNNKLVMKIPESYVKIKKIDIQDVAVSFEQKLNNNQAASKAVISKSTSNNLLTVSLLGNPSSEVQAPLTAFFLPSARSEQTGGSAVPDHSDNGSGSGLFAEDVITSKSPGEDMDMQSQPWKRNLAPSTQAPSPMSTFHSRASPVRTPAARTLPPSQIKARPDNITLRLSSCSSRLSMTQPSTLETHPGQFSRKVKNPVQSSIPVDSSDLPEGWRRLKVPRIRHSITGQKRRINRYDLYILTSGPDARKLKSQKAVDAYIEKKKLNQRIKFRPWLNGNAHKTPLPWIPPPSQPPPVNMSSRSVHPAPATNPSIIRPVRKLPPLNQQVLPTKSAVTPTPPCSPVLPLSTMAKALASLGGKEEGSKKLVLFHLNDQQIKAFNTLGVKEVGIVDSWLMLFCNTTTF